MCVNLHVFVYMYESKGCCVHEHISFDSKNTYILSAKLNDKMTVNPCLNPSMGRPISTKMITYRPTNRVKNFIITVHYFLLLLLLLHCKRLVVFKILWKNIAWSKWIFIDKVVYIRIHLLHYMMIVPLLLCSIQNICVNIRRHYDVDSR